MKHVVASSNPKLVDRLRLLSRFCFVVGPNIRSGRSLSPGQTEDLLFGRSALLPCRLFFNEITREGESLLTRAGDYGKLGHVC